MRGGFCQRIRKTLRPALTMFKRQKIDGGKSPGGEGGGGRTSPRDGDARQPAAADPVKVKYLEAPVKPPSDTKEYQVIRLPNGLTATLVSDVKNLIDLAELEAAQSDSDLGTSGSEGEESEDGAESESSEAAGGRGEGAEPKEKLAACSLTVEVGSFSDPVDIQGLAHFLEHMVFMGSAKYPKENEFDSFIKKHGGSDNAFTECQYTTYHFECPEQRLLEAMDVFSQFFIAPMLKWDAINREREAIESEFQEAFPHDSYRKDQLLSSFASEGNPAKKFTWGNQFTLRDNVTDARLHEAVTELRAAHYSADRMRLAVQGRLPLPVLRRYVVDCFAQVPRLPNKADTFAEMERPFDMAKFHRLYHVQSVQDVTEVELRWVLPPVLRHYRTKPLKYLSFIIGHEGAGSLLSYLKQKVWALGLRAGCADDGLNVNDIYTIFVIGITLTDEGRRRVEDVLRSTFSYLAMLSERAPDRRLFEEVQSLAEVGFKFQEESPATDNVETLSQNMLLFPPADYLRGDELYFDYDPQLIRSFLTKLTPTTVNVMLFSKNHTLPLTSEEFWFKTKYASEEIPKEWTTSWSSVTPQPDFQLPERNQFIPTDFTLLAVPPAPAKYPALIGSSDEGVQIWYKADDKFRLPIASVDILLVTPQSLESAAVTARVAVFLQLLHHQLVEELFHAVAADLEYSISLGETSVQVGVYGFNQHIGLLVDRIACGFRDFASRADEAVLAAFKTLTRRAYYNDTLRAGGLAKEVRLGAYLAPHFAAHEKYKHVGDITLSQLQSLSADFFRQVHFQALVQGNISAEDGERIVRSFVNTVRPQTTTPLPVAKSPQRLIRVLPKGETCFQLESYNLEDKNCVTTVYFQYGPGTIAEYVALQLFVMIMEEPLFDKLRTQQQLGYDVSTTVRQADGILGLSVTVHSQINKFTVDHVKQKIDEFLLDFVQTFTDLDDEEFRVTRGSLVNLKSCVDTNLKMEARRNLEEIKCEEFVFDRLEKEIELISELDKSGVAALAAKLFTAEHRKLVVQVVGHESAADDNAITEDDHRPAPAEHSLPDDIALKFLPNSSSSSAEEFDFWRNSLPTYPPHKLIH